MSFSDLVVCNKLWEENTPLIVISQDDLQASPVTARIARSLFGKRQVLWFRDCVVMVL